MALTPDGIERRQFATSPNGYNRDEVDAFLVEAAASFRSATEDQAAELTPPGDPGSTASRTNLGEVAREVAEILEAASRAADSMIAEAENDATRVRASADHHAAQVREQADSDRERVKRLLLRSEEQAKSIVAQAEEQAQQQRAIAERDSVRRTRDSLARAKRRAHDLSLAEQQLLERLTEIRASIDILLTEGSANVEPMSEADRNPKSGRRSSDVEVRPGPTNNGSDFALDIDIDVDVDVDVEDLADRTSRLVEAAVQRAASAASGGSPPARRADPTPAPEARAISTF